MIVLLQSFQLLNFTINEIPFVLSSKKGWYRDNRLSITSPYYLQTAFDDLTFGLETL